MLPFYRVVRGETKGYFVVERTAALCQLSPLTNAGPEGALLRLSSEGRGFESRRDTHGPEGPVPWCSGLSSFPHAPSLFPAVIHMEFNETKQFVSERTETTNYEGGEAFEPDTPKLQLYKLVINNLLEDTYYRDDEQALAEVREAFSTVAAEDPEYPLKLAYYAREEMYLRDIAQVLLVLSSRHDEAKQYVRDYAPNIIQRADEPATVLAIHDTLFGKAAPKPLKKGINDALHNFDAYQFAKYDSDRREVNLRDVVNRTHPTPRDDEHDEIFERLILGPLDDHPEVEPLDTPETWETVISERGSTREAWEDVLPRMGLFARLRNIRNMLEVGVSAEDIFDEEDLEYVEESKIYPFRFYQAYKAVQEAGLSTPEIEDWLSEAIDVAAGELPDELESTFVAVDLSGSMDSPLSENSSMTYMEIAAFFGAVLMRKGAATSVFAEGFDLVNAHHNTPTLELVDKILSQDVGHSTNGWKVLEFLTQQDLVADRVVLLTDMQIWDSTSGFGRSGNSVKSSFDTYRQEVAPETALYMVDLSSYGDLVTPEGYEQVFNVSGWNDNILDFIQYAESPGEIVEEVEGWMSASRSR